MSILVTHSNNKKEKIHGPAITVIALWFWTFKNRNRSTGPIASLFARSLAPLTHSLAPHCSLRSRAPRAHSFTRSVTHSRFYGKVDDPMSQNDLVLSHSALVKTWVIASWLVINQSKSFDLYAWSKYPRKSRFWIRIFLFFYKKNTVHWPPMLLNGASLFCVVARIQSFC